MLDSTVEHEIFECAMKFARIEMFVLIWTLPVFALIFYYGFKKRRSILTRFSSPRGLSSTTPDASLSRRYLKAAFIVLSMLFTVFALTGPQYGYKWIEIERRGVDIIIAIDCSKSMLADDIKPTRLDRAKREIYDLLRMMEGDRVGLVAFSGTAFLQCPLTLDYDAFYLFLDTLTPDYLPVGGTDLAAAVSTAVESFDAKTNSEKAIILITDGEHTGAEDPLGTVEAAKQKEIKLFCIGVGGTEAVPVPSMEGGFKKDGSGNIVLTKLDEDMLKKMSVATGGVYVRSVAGDMDLDVIYKDRIRGAMDRQTLESGKKQIFEDRFQWFVGLAVIFLLIELLTPSVKKTAIFSLVLLAIMVFPIPTFAGNMEDGLAAYQNKEYEKALKHFIDEQLKHPEKPEVLYNVGNAYYKTGDFEAAKSHYEQALETEDPALKEKTLYNLGNTHYRLGQPEEAIKNYTEALNINPDDKMAKENIEFVKKMIEQQKQQQESGNQNDGEQKEPEDQQESGDKEGNAEKQEQQKPQEQSGDDEQKPKPKPSKDGEEESSEQRQTGSDEDKGDQTEQKETARQAEPTENTDEENREKQADRILDRLEDKPGKALMPYYEKREVEKDW